MKNCSACGKALSDNAKFCSGCGAKLDLIINSSKVNINSRESINEAPKNNEMHKSIGAVIALIFLITGIGIYSFRESQSNLVEGKTNSAEEQLRADSKKEELNRQIFEINLARSLGSCVTYVGIYSERNNVDSKEVVAWFNAISESIDWFSADAQREWTAGKNDIKSNPSKGDLLTDVNLRIHFLDCVNLFNDNRPGH